MKFSFFLIPLIILSACTLVPEPDETAHIQSLEQQVADLKRENANLQEENNLLKAG